ncbi:MAG: 50S ribosomal protein L30 [Kiritimatiellae bacterium]|nr:50S ribosomal protein L30 [Kiritimatiellia bacterium]
MMKQLKITLVKSPIACIQKHIRTVEALGLRKLHQTVVHNDTPSIRGMIFTVKHMVTVEEVE